MQYFRLLLSFLLKKAIFHENYEENHQNESLLKDNTPKNLFALLHCIQLKFPPIKYVVRFYRISSQINFARLAKTI